jgi:RND family efflux transporter MFP subunit
MAPQESQLRLDIVAFASRLLEVHETSARARVTAQAVLEWLPGTTVTVYILQEDAEKRYWSARSTVGEEAQPDQVVPAEAGTLGVIFRDQKTTVFDGATLEREAYAHLNVRRTVKYLACVALVNDETLIGAIEILGFEGGLDRLVLPALGPLADLAAQALVSSQAYEEERHNSMTSITRLTQFYDIEKVFSSTLEMDELLPIIGGKMREMLECQAVNVWMVQGDESLLLMHQAGWDPTTRQGMTQKGGQGIAGDVSDNGEPVLITDPHDERLIGRNLNTDEGRVESIVVAPLLDKESLVGVVEVVNRLDGTPFDEDDLFVLTSLNETATIALHNASLLLAERKVEVLETLVKVSAEITSTLNLERVLQAVVNHTQAIIPFERAAIALEQRGVLLLKAISGMTRINAADPAVSGLKEMLEWASISTGETHVTQRGDQIDDPRHETQAKFAAYFSATGMRAFYAFPLIDDQGRLGVLSFESSDPDFLTVAHLEIIKVLASQATVALRNASLYREVPFINFLEPLLQKKRRFLALEKHRRWLMTALGVALGLFLIVCPLPMRVSGDATVASARTAQVQAGVDGVVKSVYTREGDHVRQGAVLAELEDWNYRADVVAAEAKYSEAMATMNRALAQNEGSLAGTERTKVDYFKAELGRARERLDRTTIRAPFDGVVTTPQVQNSVGRRLIHSDTFAEIMETSHVTVDVAVSEDVATLLHSSEHASIKLESFPLRTFRGEVTVVSPQSHVESEQRVFLARVNVSNHDGAIRPGMQGHGKVSVGWHPAGYVLFRGSAMWLWGKLWSWFGW